MPIFLLYVSFFSRGTFLLQSIQTWMRGYEPTLSRQHQNDSLKAVIPANYQKTVHDTSNRVTYASTQHRKMKLANEPMYGMKRKIKEEPRQVKIITMRYVELVRAFSIPRYFAVESRARVGALGPCLSRYVRCAIVEHHKLWL